MPPYWEHFLANMRKCPAGRSPMGKGAGGVIMDNGHQPVLARRLDRGAGHYPAASRRARCTLLPRPLSPLSPWPRLPSLLRALASAQCAGRAGPARANARGPISSPVWHGCQNPPSPTGLRPPNAAGTAEEHGLGDRRAQPGSSLPLDTRPRTHRLEGEGDGDEDTCISSVLILHPGTWTAVQR